MWLKEIDNKLVPPPVNYITGDLTILNFNLNEQAMLDNGWRDWTPEEIAAWEALHPVPEPPTPVVPYYTKSETDEQIAEAIGEIPPQVQSDWDESDSEALSYIQNKPEIPAAQVQADWDESDSTAVDYIKNKPTKFEQEQADWDESDSSDASYIRNKPDMSEYLQKSMDFSLPASGQAYQMRWKVDGQNAISILAGASGFGYYTYIGSEYGFADIKGKAINLSYGVYIGLNGHRQNEKGGFCISDATTGDLTVPGSVISLGDSVSTVTATNNALAIPAKSGYVYLYTAVENDVITFDTPANGDSPEFELDITQGATVATFTLPTVTWSNGIAPQFDAASTTTRCKFQYVDGTWYGWVTPDMSEYLLRSGGTVTGKVEFPDGLTLGYSSGNPFYLVDYHAILTVSNVRTTISNDRVDIGSLYGDININPGGAAVSGKHLNFKGHAENTPGGFCISDDTTGNLTLPGTLTSAGQEILTPATTTIAPGDNKVYKHLLAASDAIAFDLASLTSAHQVNFEVHLTQPSTAVTFTLPSGILWGDEYGDYDLSNPAPVISTPNTVYCLVFRWDGEVLMGNLTYTRAAVADESSSSGV